MALARVLSICLATVVDDTVTMTEKTGVFLSEMAHGEGGSGR